MDGAGCNIALTRFPHVSRLSHPPGKSVHFMTIYPSYEGAISHSIGELSEFGSEKPGEDAQLGLVRLKKIDYKSWQWK